MMKVIIIFIKLHRLSTIAHLNGLIVMNEGQIIEDGTHNELLAQKGLYSNLWEMQSGGFINKKLND